MIDQLKAADLGKRVKSKYPGVYDHIPDIEIGQKYAEKHPAYMARIQDTSSTAEQGSLTTGTGAKQNIATRFLRGVDKFVFGGQGDAAGRGIAGAIFSGTDQAEELRQVASGQGGNQQLLRNAIAKSDVSPERKQELAQMLDRIAKRAQGTSEYLETGGDLSTREVAQAFGTLALTFAASGQAAGGAQTGHLAQGGISAAQQATASGLQQGLAATSATAGARIARGAVTGGAFGLLKGIGDEDAGAKEIALKVAGGAAVGAATSVLMEGARVGVKRIATSLSGADREAIDRILQDSSSVKSGRDVLKQGYVAPDGTTYHGKEGLARNIQKHILQYNRAVNDSWDEGINGLSSQYKDQTFAVDSKHIAAFEKLKELFPDQPFLADVDPTKVTIEQAIRMNTLANSVRVGESSSLADKATQRVLGGFHKYLVGDQVDDTVGAIAANYGDDAGNFTRNWGHRKEIVETANKAFQAYGNKTQSEATSSAIRNMRSLYREDKVGYINTLLEMERDTGFPILGSLDALQTTGILPPASTNLKVGGGVGPMLFHGVKVMLSPLFGPRATGATAQAVGNINRVLDVMGADDFTRSILIREAVRIADDL